MPTIILFAPLVGAVLCGFGWRIIGERPAQIVATALLFLSMTLSWVVFFTFDPGVAETTRLFRWIESGSLIADWAIRLDTLTAIMLVVITTVSALVHLYSFGYMADDENWKKGETYRPRFFAYLSLFTFMMLALVTADNLVQMFFGWEGVGLASYLLIGFYYRKSSANAASIKAFVMNRVGDFGFLLGMFATFFLFDSIEFEVIFSSAPELADTTVTFLWREWNALEVLSVLLFIGAMGKSAQLFLHTWLPDAMEGPTPVSALIHAATMVTAGVFLVCRMSPVLEWAPGALTFITYIGALTAFVAATIGLVQNDIKRVIAWSTCSQLGYMFAAAGVGAYPVAMFHLFTHAWFKALLFLGAGSVITAMHHEQDMRNYGGLRDKVPYTFWAMIIGTLAITGVGIPLTHYGFAGFLSKDAVIESVWASGTSAAQLAFWLLLIAAVMTAFYSWRLIFLTFFGKPRGDRHAHEHAQESPASMLIPLAVLGVGALFSGMLWYGSFFGDGSEEFFGASVVFSPENTVIHDAHQAPAWVVLSPFAAMIIGTALAFWFYIVNPAMPVALARTNESLHRFLLNRWYFDTLYDRLFVRPTFALGRILWKGGDGRMIDGLINGLSMGVVPFFTRLAGRAQSGYVFHYAFAMFLGLVVLILILMLAGRG